MSCCTDRARRGWCNCKASPAPERAGREGDQPLPTEGDGDVIRDAIAHLEARRVVGVKRYGRPLQAFNGRDGGRDELEEFLDGFVYRHQLRLERAALEERLRVAEARIADLERDLDDRADLLRKLSETRAALSPGAEDGRGTPAIAAAVREERDAARFNLEEARQALDAEIRARQALEADLRALRERVEALAADADRQSRCNPPALGDPIAVAGPWAWKRIAELLRGALGAGG